MAINVEKLRNYGIRIFKERNWKKLTRNYFGGGMSMRSLVFQRQRCFCLDEIESPIGITVWVIRLLDACIQAEWLLITWSTLTRVPISSRSFYGFCLIETRELRVLMSSVVKIVNKIYKTGINIEGLVNYFYQIAKNGENVLQFRR